MRNMAGIKVVVVGIVLAGLCTFAQTQADLNVSADEEVKKADADLNAVYAQVTPLLDDAQKALLKQSQVAWIKYRDLCVTSEGTMYEGGSMRPMVELKCAAGLTAEKADRLRGMLPDAITKTKTALPSADAQQVVLQKADVELNKVYKDYMAMGPSPAVKEAQVAWLSYRDLCAKAEAALYDEEVVPIVAAKCAAELTLARTVRLKGLFMEGYPSDSAKDASPVPPTEPAGVVATSAQTKVNSGSWVGQYAYDEFAPPDQTWAYKLIVSPKGSALAAQLEIDGFQVMRRIVCDALIDGQKLLVKFASYGEDDIHYTDDLAPGQILLTLERSTDGSLLTYWGAVAAQLEKNQPSGKVYFLAATGKVNEQAGPAASSKPKMADDPVAPLPTSGVTALTQPLAADTPTGSVDKGIIDGVLHFKGLHLGMKLEDAATILDKLGMEPDRDKNTGGYEITKLALDDSLIRVSRSPFPNKDIKAWQVISTKDPDKTVVRFIFSGGSVGRLFGLGDMTPAEFVEAFRGAYGIPEMERYVCGNKSVAAALMGFQPDMEGVMYRDRQNGWELVIFEDKTLHITTITKAAQAKFN